MNIEEGFDYDELHEGDEVELGNEREFVKINHVSVKYPIECFTFAFTKTGYLHIESDGPKNNPRLRLIKRANRKVKKLTRKMIEKAMEKSNHEWVLKRDKTFLDYFCDCLGELRGKSIE